MRPLFEKVLPKGTFLTLENRPEGELARVKQTHSSIIIPYKGEALDDTEADGVVFKYATLQTNRSAVAITTADCLPILFLGEKSGAFVHAGWRGLAASIHTAPEISNIRPDYAFIGPHISSNHFEVQEDFKKHFKEEKFYQERNGKLYFDLEAKAIEDLKLEFPGLRIETSGQCTYGQEKYNSFRRTATSSRNWNIFRL